MSKKSRKTQLRIALAGASGRMGQEIQALAEKHFVIQAKLDAGAKWSKVSAQETDVVIDFSTPEGLAEALAWALAEKKPLVSGTTGLPADLISKMKKASAKIPILYSGNMSLGIAALSAMLPCLRMLADWDFQIEEAHHSRKKDKPSGTALLLQRELEKSVGRPLPPPNAVRGGGIPGIHQVWAMGEDEVITLQHTAFNRKVFARGALNAARWLFDKKLPGFYELSDLYKI